MCKIDVVLKPTKVAKMSEQKSKKTKIPQRRNPPIYPASFAVGILQNEDIITIDIMDSQHVEPNVSFFSFVLTKRKAKILKEAIDSFLDEEITSNE